MEGEVDDGPIMNYWYDWMGGQRLSFMKLVIVCLVGLVSQAIGIRDFMTQVFCHPRKYVGIFSQRKLVYSLVKIESLRKMKLLN